MASMKKVTLEDLHTQIQEGMVKELNIVIKADVSGSAGAIVDSLEKLSTAAVKLKVIHSSVGAITETDVMLAAASNAIIIGFSVRPEPKAHRTCPARRRGHPAVQYHLQRHRRHQGGHGRPARTDAQGEDPGPRRSAPDLPCVQGRHHRRFLRRRTAS